MKYRIRIFNKKNNEEHWLVEDLFENEQEADEFMKALPLSFSSRDFR